MREKSRSRTMSEMKILNKLDLLQSNDDNYTNLSPDLEGMITKLMSQI